MVTTLERPLVKPPIAGRAAIYLRVSSHKQQDGASLAVQLEFCLRCCANASLDVVVVFEDVMTGLRQDRPQYQQALALARDRGFDFLVVFKYDRTGRDDAEYAGMLKDFAKLGIQLVSASGESQDPFYQKLAGLLAWEESRRLSIRVSGSKMKRHEEGKWNGRPVFGYTIEKHSQGGTYLVPKEGESELVTEMFSRYASGSHSLLDLRRFLTQSGVAKGRSGILYLLNNRTYLGLAPYGRNIRSQFHPAPEEMDWVAGAHQPLVDQDTFDRVQARLGENRHRQRGGTAPRYIFSGLIICGACGNKYVGRHGNKDYNWYTCNRQQGFGDCKSHTVYESDVKEVVIPPIERLIQKMSQAEIQEAVRAELISQEQAAAAATQVSNKGKGEQMDRLLARLTNLENDYLDREISRIAIDSGAMK